MFYLCVSFLLLLFVARYELRQPTEFISVFFFQRSTERSGLLSYLRTVHLGRASRGAL